MELSNEFEAKALELGFTNALWIENLDLSEYSDPNIRTYCNPRQCRRHGSNWVCPPGCGTFEECAEKASQFNCGLLLQSVTEVDIETMNYGTRGREHNQRLRDFIENSCTGIEVLALSSGGCILCEECAYPEPCIYPDQRMNSLSAFGVNVSYLCVSSGMEYSFVQDTLRQVALVMMKSESLSI
ncbi:MAG: DUF2284 domain-containing protein [Eubacteriaceae bacterium]|nr:DUF2284 domain-containing protein [Eubacteriaceae bacterium]